MQALLLLLLLLLLLERPLLLYSRRILLVPRIPPEPESAPFKPCSCCQGPKERI